MLIVVAMNLSMTFKTYGDCIVYCIWATFCPRDYVIRFDLHTAKSVTDTTTTMGRG